MPVLSPNQIAAYAIGAGFTGEDVAIAVAVAIAESSGNTDAMSPPNTNGTTDYGLWQINTIHNPTAKDWKDPAVNAAMAKKVFDDRKKTGSSGWAAWSVFNSRKYLLYMGQGKLGADKPDTSISLKPGEGLGNKFKADEPTVSLASIGKFMDLLSDPKTWWRVGYFVLGTFLLLYGLFTVFKNSKTGQAVQGVAMKVAKVAVLKGV